MERLIEWILGLIAAVATFLGALWALRGDRLSDEQAAAEVVRLRIEGLTEDKIPPGLLRQAERHGKRMRKQTGGDW